MHEEEPLDYEEDVSETEEEKAKEKTSKVEKSITPTVKSQETFKGLYISIHSSGFRDYLFKPEISRAIVDSGFEHPSEVQHECLPQAMLGMDVLCQAKSGMGKTAVFVLSTLQLLDMSDNVVHVLVMCHTRELAFQIRKEYLRFSKYIPQIKTAVFFGGLPIKNDIEVLQSTCPHVVVGTPGRILALIRIKKLDLKNLKHFVLDECDKMLSQLDMRKDVQEIFKNSNLDKQVMMFSATLPKEIRPVCKKFMNDPMEIYVDEDKLNLHGLLQYYVKVDEKGKTKKLVQLLDTLEFNQIIIFVRSIERCEALTRFLLEQNFSPTFIHGKMAQEERLNRYQAFKEFQNRILVSTDLFGRGIDIERINIVFNYDMPENSIVYRHRVGRAGRFGTKGLALTFISNETDAEALNKIQEIFFVNISELPDKIDEMTYIEGGIESLAK